MIEDILKANREFLSKQRTVSAPSETGSGHDLAIVACMDPRLDRFLPAAFGLPDGAAYIIRNAGNTCTRWDETIPRSVAVAVLRGGVHHVAVVGHTDCAMAADTLVLLDALRKAGVPREAFGDRDPREWFGAIAGIESNVRNVVDLLHRSSVLPGGIAVYGLIIDTQTGELRSLASEKTAGLSAPDKRTAPRKGDSLEKVLGGSVTDSFVPKAGFVPVTNAPPAVEVPPPPTSGARSIVPPEKPPPVPAPAANVTPPESRPKTEPPPRPNIRRDRESVPIDPREAQDFFRRREMERERKKRM
jgi:carbonic anhydrase